MKPRYEYRVVVDEDEVWNANIGTRSTALFYADRIRLVHPNRNPRVQYRRTTSRGKWREIRR